MKGGRDKASMTNNKKQLELFNILPSDDIVKIIYMIRCCYMSKDVADRMIAELTNENKYTIIEKLKNQFGGEGSGHAFSGFLPSAGD